MANNSQFRLLLQRRFAPFFWTQFLGALNDNVFKNALLIMIAYQAASWSGLSTNSLTNLCAALFILPFFLFSASAGQLADKYEKAHLIRWIKLAEIFIMITAAVGFYFNYIGLLLLVLFALGVQSTMFGPVKYAILPQHLDTKELMNGNSLVEMGTFLAILMGTIIGGLLIGDTEHGKIYLTIAVLIIAGLGFWSCRYIPKAEPVASDIAFDWNVFRVTWCNIQRARKNKTIYLSIMGISWFWFYGTFIVTQLPVFTKLYLHGDAHVVTIFLAAFSVGIGSGSILSAKLAKGHIEIGFVPIGSLGLSVFLLDLAYALPQADLGHLLSVTAYLQQANSYRALMDAVMIGVFGGLFTVPLYALIQDRSDESERSRIISANNIFNAIFMVASALFAMYLLSRHVTIPELFVVVSVMNIAVVAFIYALVPEFIMRLLVWSVVGILYRIRCRGLVNIPSEGPAVIVANHISFVDPLIISTVCHRPMRFVMYHKIFKIPVMNFIFRTARAIPIAPAKEDVALKDKAFADIKQALADGDLVCLFPEGSISYDGEIANFRPGIEEILQESPVPVIPLALQGLWGSFFSRRYGAAMSQFPKRIFFKIGVNIGQPIAATKASAAYLQEQVEKLRGDWQ